MNTLRGSLLICVYCIVSARSGTVQAQPLLPDSLIYNNAVANLIALYHQSSGDQSALYNGSQYGGYPFVFAAGHPFFKEDRPGTGTIVYDGILYDHVMLQFDEVKDVVILDSSSRRIQLLNDRISRFTLFDHVFLRIVKDSSNAVLPGTGFYDLLYQGKTSLLKKEDKLVRDDVTSGELLRYPDERVYYFIKKDAAWYNINSRKSVLSLFKDRKKDIRPFIRKNKLSYRKDRDNMLAKVTAYYDQLTK